MVWESGGRKTETQKDLGLQASGIFMVHDGKGQGLATGGCFLWPRVELEVCFPLIIGYPGLRHHT
jgi:hypothetical protein